jgi:hypothetical protein
VVDGQAVAALYQNPGFGHALSYLTGSPRPDMLAAVAHLGGEVGEPTLFAGRPPLTEGSRQWQQGRGTNRMLGNGPPATM